MSADKRSPITDALETLGTILAPGAARDAIHLAVEPVIAGEELRPGRDVGFLPDGKAGSCEKPVGIVDPFLRLPVMAGERFWLIVYPRKITSLRHVWEHPDFPVNKARDESLEWLTKFASDLDRPLQDLLDNAEQYLTDPDHYWTGGETFEGEATGHTFWEHFQNYTGIFVPADNNRRGNFLNCSC